jgi:hypothetical protein
MGKALYSESGIHSGGLLMQSKTGLFLLEFTPIHNETTE